MPLAALAQAVTTVVAQPRANACKLHCVAHSNDYHNFPWFLMPLAANGEVALRPRPSAR